MKKIFILLLVLAVAGIAFAQEVKFTGSVQTGLAIGFTNSDTVKPQIGYVRNRGEQGLRADFNIAATSADGTYGANVSFRGRYNDLFVDTFSQGLVPTANLWWQAMPELYIHLGTGGPAGFGTMGGMDASQGLLDAHGLKLRITPMDGLDIAAQLFYAGGNNLEDFAFGTGVKYTMPDLVSVVANLKFDARDAEMFFFGIGANYLGLANLGFTKIAVDFTGNKLGSDPNGASLGIGESISFVTGALSAGLDSKQLINIGDVGESFGFRIRANVQYALDSLTPRLEVAFATGGTIGSGYRNAYEGLDAGFVKDAMGLAIAPSVAIRLGGPSLTLGYNLRMDLTDYPDTEESPAPAVTMRHLIYAGIDVSF